MTKKETLILSFILAAVFVSFFPSLGGEFTNWDDYLLVVDNPEIRSLDFNHIKAIFTSTASRGYIPFTILSFAVEHHFFGLNPFVFHLDNVLLHLGVVTLLFVLALRLGLNLWAAGLAALVFGIHPMHVESVAWVSARKDGLYAVFYLLAMHSYLTYIKRCHPEYSEGSFVKDSSAFGLRMTIAEKGHKSFFVLAIVFGILSMLAKPMALSLPLILLLLDWMKGRRLTLNVFLEKVPHVFYIVPLILITYRIHDQPVPTTLPEGTLTWIWSAAFYLWTFVWPFVLSPLYLRPEPAASSNPLYVAAVVTVLAFVWMLIRFRGHRWTVFAGLFYVLSIFFLFRFGVSQYSVVADRYMYLPSAGFCFLFGIWIHQGFVCLKKPPVRWAAAAGLVILSGGLLFKTSTQCKVWKNSLTLWNEMIRHNPDSWFAFYNRGRAYEYQESLDLAVGDYTRAIAINPGFVSSYNNRAAIFIRQGRDEEAFRDLSQAEKLDPGVAEIYSNRAIIHMRRSDYEAALADLNMALKLRPDFMQALTNRGVVYAGLKRFDLAVEDYDHALRINPSNADIYFYRSLAYADMNRLDSALRDAVQAKALGHPDIDDYLDQLKKHASQ